jgi:hypothetical protein
MPSHTFLLHSENFQQKLGDSTGTKKRLKKLKKRLELVENLELAKILSDHKLVVSSEKSNPIVKP